MERISMEHFSKPLSPFPYMCLVVVSVLVYTVCLGVYRVFIHPLRRYPGPWLSAASSFPLLLNRWFGREHKYAEACHLRYGPRVRIAPYEISYNTFGAWKDIYGHKIGDRGNIEKKYEINIPAIGGRNSILWASEEDHKRQRRLLSHAFSDKAIREQEVIVRQYVDLMVSQMSSRIADSKGAAAVFDMVNWFSFVTFDVIADLAFGQELGMLRRGEWTPWMGAIFDSFTFDKRISWAKQYMPSISPLVDFMIPTSLRKAAQLHASESGKQIDARLARETDRPDFWTYILRNQGREDKSQMTNAEMHATGKTLMLAGTETSATLLTGLTSLLVTHPEKLAKLVREIRDTFTSADEIDMAGIARLPYLHACIEEAFRVHPSVALGLPRVVPEGGRIIEDNFVPAKTTVYVSNWCTFRSESHFAEPLEYIPERWLEDQPDQRFKNDHREVMQPFSYGPRNCLGKNLAYHEIRLIMTNLLWHFDLHDTGKNGDDWLDQKNYGLWQKPPLMLKLTLASQVKGDS